VKSRVDAMKVEQKNATLTVNERVSHP